MHEGIIVFCIEKFFLVMIPVFSIASLNFEEKGGIVPILCRR